MYEEYQHLPDHIRRVMETFGTRDEINWRMEAFARATDRLFAMSEELTEKYPDHWAALSGDELIIAESLPELSRKYNEAGIEKRGMAIRFLWTKRPVMVL